MQDGVSNKKHGEQPPSAVLLQTIKPLAKPVKNEYRRNLPHLQAEDKPVYLTFCTYKRWHLPTSVRSLIIHHCLHDHGTKLQVHGLVVMPDHVHMVFTALKDRAGNVFGLTEIMSGIKGASAHSIKKALNRKGPVWQYESFDHILRADEKIREKVEYICQKPVRKGLVGKEDDYPWLWREWVEGEKKYRAGALACFFPGNISGEKIERTAGGGCSTFFKMWLPWRLTDPILKTNKMS